MQVHALYLLDAKAASSEEVEGGTSKLFLISVVADFVGCGLKRVERNICELRRFREVVIRVEIQMLFRSACRCMRELKEKW